MRLGRVVRRLGFAAVLLVVVGAAAGVTSAAASSPPKAYYLALGDSQAYGYQKAKADAGLPPSAFNTGYVDDLARRLRARGPTLVTVNYRCPGESTDSFISGPCPHRK
jgi:lysophospholipase L1-like esterase